MLAAMLAAVQHIDSRVFVGFALAARRVVASSGGVTGLSTPVRNLQQWLQAARRFENPWETTGFLERL